VGVVATTKLIGAMLLGLRFMAFALRKSGNPSITKPLDVATAFTWAAVLTNMIRQHEVGMLTVPAVDGPSPWLLSYTACAAFSLSYGFRVVTNNATLSIGSFPFNHDKLELLETLASLFYVIQLMLFPKFFLDSNFTFAQTPGVMATVAMLGVFILSLRVTMFLARSAAIPSLAKTLDVSTALTWGFCLIWNIMTKPLQTDQGFVTNVGLTGFFLVAFGFRTFSRA